MTTNIPCNELLPTAPSTIARTCALVIIDRRSLEILCAGCRSWRPRLRRRAPNARPAEQHPVELMPPLLEHHLRSSGARAAGGRASVPHDTGNRRRYRRDDRWAKPIAASEARSMHVACSGSCLPADPDPILAAQSPLLHACHVSFPVAFRTPRPRPDASLRVFLVIEASYSG